MDDKLVKHMLSQFLGWKLPSDFAPDGGISFTPPDKTQPHLWPLGANLLSLSQAIEMVEYMLKDAHLEGEVRNEKV